MSADIRCYDQNTGKLLFNIASQTSRIVGYVTDSTTSGTITVPDLGGGKLFWMLLDDDIDYQVQNLRNLEFLNKTQIRQYTKILFHNSPRL